MDTTSDATTTISTTTQPVAYDPYQSQPVSLEWQRIMVMVRSLANPRPAFTAREISYFI